MTDNIAWVLLAGILVVLMQGGFALVNSGLCRAKSAGQIVTMNFMIYPLAVLGFWVCGFALLFHLPSSGAEQWFGDKTGEGLGMYHYHRFFFGSPDGNPLLFRLFFYQAAIVAVAAAIPIGAMAERWRFSNFILYGCWAGALPIALFGNAVWHGLWLEPYGLGHGFVDFAGSSMVHMAGGVMALAGAWALGPRIGKYSRDGRPRPMPGHNLVYMALGTILLAVGWFGFNLGPALAYAPERTGVIVVNTLLASATGTIGACIMVISKFGKPDPSMLCNGMLAGLAAISGPCAFINPVGAVIVGLVAGILVVYSVLFFEGKMKIDDPVGAISVHGIGGAWGVLSLGLLANGSYGVSGAFGKLFGGPANDWSQFGAQAIGVLACLVFIGLFAFIWFKITKAIVPMRSRREEEIAGLDLPEMGAECYPDFHLSDKSATRND